MAPMSMALSSGSPTRSLLHARPELLAGRRSAIDFLDEQPRTGAAHLALVEPDRVDQRPRPPRRGRHRRTPRRATSHPARATAVCPLPAVALRIIAADVGRAGEGDLVDVRHARPASRPSAVAGHDVQHARRQTRPSAADLGEQQRRQRCELGWLEDHRIAHRQRRRDLPGQHQQREVPRDDLPHHAHRLVPGQLVSHQLRPAGVIREMARHQRMSRSRDSRIGLPLSSVSSTANRRECFWICRARAYR